MSDHPALYFPATREPVVLDGRRDEISIGRGESQDVVIPDGTCSRRQCRLVRRDDGHVLVPVSPRVKTRVNGKVVEAPTPLRHGDVIRFGATECVYRTRPEPVQPSPSAPVETSLPPRTLRASASTPPPPAQSVERFRIGARTVIGRDPRLSNHRLDHPLVSRRHAEVTRRTDHYVLRDCGSANGTFVNARRLDGAVRLRPGDLVAIGPYSLRFTGDGFDASTQEGNLRLVGRRLIRDVRSHDTGGRLRILNDVTLVVEPREFVCLLGPSGSGKTTLMNALSAREPATSGSVEINGRDLYQSFESLKGGIALVPQKDVLHENLLLRDALGFTARLRLPPDTSVADRDGAVERVLREVELAERAGHRIRNLSGGQKKRASLANETLSKPDLLFLDEVTSGLDERTDWEMMRLFRRLADRGMTVVCVTHSLANVAEFTHRLVIMKPPGVLAFFGTPSEALGYFEVEELGQIYGALERRSPEEWADRFRASEEHEQYVTRRLEASAATPAATSPSTSAAESSRGASWRETVRQWRILSTRYAADVLADRKSLLIAAIQCLVIGAALATIWSAPEGPLPVPRLVFFLGISCFWFGCNNASKEIVKERPLYRLERDVNLSPIGYAFSKLSVLALLSLLQVVLLYGVVRVGCEAVKEVRVDGSGWTQLLLLELSALTGVAAGLLISAASKSTDQANTLVPIVLIPQILLTEAIVQPADRLPDLKVLVTGYWIYEGLFSVESIMDESSTWLRFGRSAVPGYPKDELLLSTLALGLHLSIYFGLAVLVLTVRDARGDGPLRRLLRRR